MRRDVAAALCTLANGIAFVLGVAAGLGATIVLIVLLANGTINLGTAALLWIVGLPAIELVLGLCAASIGGGLLLLARALDREVAEAWAAESQHDAYY